MLALDVRSSFSSSSSPRSERIGVHSDCGIGDCSIASERLPTSAAHASAQSACGDLLAQSLRSRRRRDDIDAAVVLQVQQVMIAGNDQVGPGC